MRSLVLMSFVVVSFATSGRLVGQDPLGEAFVFQNEAGDRMPYRLFSPTVGDLHGEGLPLVVFLHGSGERGTDNRLQVATHIGGLIDATQSEEFAAFLLAPQLPDNRGWNADGTNDLTLEIINSLTASLPIDVNRIYVTGLSLGGFGAFEYLTQYPDMFAAAVPMSGGFRPDAAAIIRDIPVWMFHGDRDDTVSLSGSRDMYAAILTAGGSPLLTEIAGGTHVIWSPVYNDATNDRWGLYDWLFSQSRGQPPFASQTFIELGGHWAYTDDGRDPGTGWTESGFDDANWKRGLAPLGFGYANQATTLSCGTTAECVDKYATFYFRSEFSVDDPANFTNVMAQIVRDDAVIVYVNGDEVFRDNNIRNTTNFDTFARTYSADEGQVAFRVDEFLVPGLNTIAVELHQANSSRDPTDLRFDLQLTARKVPEPSTWVLLSLGMLAGAFRFRRKPDLATMDVD